MKRLTTLLFLILLPLLGGCSLGGGEADLAAEAPAPMTLADGTYQLNTESSMLYWSAYKLVGGHIGGVSLKSGELIVQDGQPHSGSFVVDMTSITNTDIEDESLRNNLVNHLKADDFFAVADYPTARFDITKVTPDEEGVAGSYLIEGDLSIRDVTNPVTVETTIKAKGDHLSASGKAEVDRTKFNINFRSGTFFENLGDQLIKDTFILEMDLVADRVQEGL